MAAHYAFYIMMTLTVSFYAYLIPIVTPMAIVIFAIKYWVDKFNLFKRSCLKYNFNFELTRNIVRIFESSIFVYAVGWVIFSFYIKGSINIFNMVGFGIALVYFLFLVFATKRMERFIFGTYEQS